MLIQMIHFTQAWRNQENVKFLVRLPTPHRILMNGIYKIVVHLGRDLEAPEDQSYHFARAFYIASDLFEIKKTCILKSCDSLKFILSSIGQNSCNYDKGIMNFV